MTARSQALVYYGADGKCDANKSQMYVQTTGKLINNSANDSNGTTSMRSRAHVEKKCIDNWGGDSIRCIFTCTPCCFGSLAPVCLEVVARAQTRPTELTENVYFSFAFALFAITRLTCVNETIEMHSADYTTRHQTISCACQSIIIKCAPPPPITEVETKYCIKLCNRVFPARSRHI